MKKTMLTGLALILALIFTAAAALAEAPSEWRIQDYVRLWQDGTIPESFDSGYTGGPETVVGGVRFRVFQTDWPVLLREYLETAGFRPPR